eukprot:gene20454-22470_t
MTSTQQRPSTSSTNSSSASSEQSEKFQENERGVDQNQNLTNFMDNDKKTLLNSQIDLSEQLRQMENEKIAVIVDHKNMMRTYNERMEVYLHEIRVLQELNKGLHNDIVELRDLCCYLDDDRRTCRRVAKEWQKFGRYTVTVMRSEVLSYSEKLNKLEMKQTDLVRENGELRDLCLYLDNKRKSEEQQGGEESGVESNSLKFVICSKCANLRKVGEDGLLEASSSSTLSSVGGGGTSRVDTRGGIDQSSDYIGKLESRIKQLEEERDFFITTFASRKDRRDKKRVSFCMPEDDLDSSSLSEQERPDVSSEFSSNRSSLYKDNQPGILRNGFLSPPPRRDSPKTLSNLPHDTSSRVTQAMRVLEIQEKLDRGSTSSTGSEDQMTDQEMTILKQMCNAAWSKLGDDQQVPLPSMLPHFNPSRHHNGHAMINSTPDNHMQPEPAAEASV